jgi:hypothetical protein
MIELVSEGVGVRVRVCERENKKRRRKKKDSRKSPSHPPACLLSALACNATVSVPLLIATHKPTT